MLSARQCSVGNNGGKAATHSTKYAMLPRCFKFGERSIEEKGLFRKYPNVLLR